ncbi:MAG: RDD family protein [Lacibacter sp.]
MTAILKKYRTFSQRLGAAIIDAVIFLPLFFLGSWVFGPDEEKSIIWLLIQNSIYFAYSVIGHSKYGFTVGKKLTNVKVVQHIDESKLLTITGAFKRELLGIVFVLVELFIIASGYADTYKGESLLMFCSLAWLFAELVTMLFNSKRRSVHDFIAGSVVIDVKVYSAWEKKHDM